MQGLIAREELPRPENVRLGGRGYALGVFTARFLRARQDDVWRRGGCRSAGQPKPPALVLNGPSCYHFRILDPPAGYQLRGGCVVGQYFLGGRIADWRGRFSL